MSIQRQQKQREKKYYKELHTSKRIKKTDNNWCNHVCYFVVIGDCAQIDRVHCCLYSSHFFSSTTHDNEFELCVPVSLFVFDRVQKLQQQQNQQSCCCIELCQRNPHHHHCYNIDKNRSKTDDKFLKQELKQYQDGFYVSFYYFFFSFKYRRQLLCFTEPKAIAIFCFKCLLSTVLLIAQSISVVRVNHLVALVCGESR